MKLQIVIIQVKWLISVLLFSTGVNALGTPEVSVGAVCNYLLYEGFAYAGNTPLHGLSGGSGFAGPWQVQGENVMVPGYQITDTGTSLTFGSLQTTGLFAGGGTQYFSSGRRLNTAVGGPFTAFVADGSDYIGSNVNGQALWFSVVLNKHQNNNDEVSVSLHGDNLAWCDLCAGTNRIAVGYFGDDSNVGGQKRWSLLLNGQVYPSTAAVVTNTSVLLVLQIRFFENHTAVDFYPNPPDLGNAGPGSPSLSLNSSNPMEIRSIAYYAGSMPGSSSIDELRMATTFSCVAPDPSVFVNLPPIAIASATPTLGDAPLMVTFNGAGSSDPEGETLTYIWDFGDGSSLTNGVTVQHIYTKGGGFYTASLTVHDPEGAQSTTTIPVGVRIPGQGISCQATVTCDAMADCNGNGGAIRVHAEPGSTATLSFQGNVISPTAGNAYLNLSVGTYNLVVYGSNGCVQEHELHIRIDSTSCAGWQSADCAMQIGINLTGIADWEPHRAFRNFLKNTRAEPIPYSDECNCWSFDNFREVLAQMQFDPDGYPLNIPQSTLEGQIKLRYFVSASGMNMPPGQTYVLKYDGTGTVTIHGTFSNVTNQPGRVQFTLGGDGTMWFQIESSQAGNHVRNVRIVRLVDEFADLDIEPFYSVFLDRIAPFQVLRFMDWMHTNNSSVSRWSDRKLPGYFTYGGDNGIPYELIIQLANQTKKDVWICVPHAADDDYIYELAQLFKMQLDTQVVVYLEYSNEVWNWIFEQAHYNVDHNPFGLMYGRAMADKARNIFRIWHEVFEGQECRVKRVLGIQAGFNYLNEHILSHLEQHEWDYGSPTHYFGLDHGETGMPRLDLLGSNATVEDIMQNAFHHYEETKLLVRQDYRNIQIYGKDIITYEGGQHFVGNVFGIPYDYQQSMWDAQKSQAMYDMHQIVLNDIRNWGCKLATAFSLAGPQENIYGSWGILDDIDQDGPFAVTAPKYQVYLDNMPSQPCVVAQKALHLECLVIDHLDDPATEKDFAFRVFPNPAADRVWFGYQGQGEVIELLDITGRVIGTTREAFMPVDHLVDGMYFFRLRNKTVTWVKF